MPKIDDKVFSFKDLLNALDKCISADIEPYDQLCEELAKRLGVEGYKW